MAIKRNSIIYVNIFIPFLMLKYCKVSNQSFHTFLLQWVTLVFSIHRPLQERCSSTYTIYKGTRSLIPLKQFAHSGKFFHVRSISILTNISFLQSSDIPLKGTTVIYLSSPNSSFKVPQTFIYFLL